MPSWEKKSKIGIGGIDSGETALEYLYAGANAVEVGAAALFEPTAPLRVARELDDLLDERPELADTGRSLFRAR